MNANSSTPIAEPKDLWQDLEQYADELYTKGDLAAGLKLLSEVVGLMGVVGLGITIMTVWLPGIGLTTTAGMVAVTLSRLMQGYALMSADQRKKVRSAIWWLKGGAFLGNRLV